MGLEWIVGPGQSGKTRLIQEMIIETTLKEPERRIIYIVPEQATLRTQQELLAGHLRGGILNVEILSFNRLAYRILEETGANAYRTLDDMGKSMLLYKTALDNQEKLLYYGSMIDRRGFIGQLKIMLTEMYQYRIDEEALRTMMRSLPQDGVLYRKLHDVLILYKGFEEKTAADTVPSEKLLDLLADKIRDSKLLEKADVYLDDFYGFTPQQYEVLLGLLQKARTVHITLKATRAALERCRPGTASRDLMDSLFYPTLKTYAKFQSMGMEGRVRYLGESRQDGELKALAEGLFLHTRPRKGGEALAARKIHAFRAERPEAEAEWVLSAIRSLVRERGYQYRDITVLSGAAGSENEVLLHLAQRYGIPLFVDQKAQLGENPAVRMLVSCLNMVLYGFTYDTFFAFVKTGFLPFPREELDRLENRALAGGWRGRSRYREELLSLSENDEALHAWTMALFDGLGDLARSGRKVSEYTETLLGFLSLGRIQEQLEERARWFHEEGQALKENLYRQTYDAVLSVFAQMDAVLGTETVTLRQYAQILNLGLSQCRLGALPPAPDQVVVADLNRSRIGGTKALFVIGFQDDRFPALTQEPGLLTDTERRRLMEYHDMASDQALGVSEQEFLLYSALSKAEESVWFSWSTGDGQGHSLRPSRYLKRIEELFQRNSLYAGSAARAEQALWLLDHLSGGGYRGMEERTVRKWLTDHGFAEEVRRMERARYETAPEEKLEPGELWDLLELSRRPVSVTQLEQYASCPFAYFLRYGLGLAEREVLSVRPLDDGNVLHTLLEEAGEYLKEAIRLSDADLEETVGRIMDEHSEEFARYKASSRYQFYWSKLKKTAVRAVRILKEQVEKGEFAPSAFEWTFGDGRTDAPALEVPLPDGRRLHLMGKIDRIDLLSDNGERYVRILDYKTGRTQWDPWEVYEGLKLQLPVYLDAYMENHPDVKPAGIFYFHLLPVLQKGDEGEEDPHRKILKSARLDGLLLKDTAVAVRMDSGITEGSDVIPAQLKKDGGFTAFSSVADNKQFDSLLRFTRRKAAEIAGNIADGRMEPSPVLQSGGTLSCSYCPYSGACRLEPASERERVRRIERRDKEEFWQTIEEWRS